MICDARPSLWREGGQTLLAGAVGEAKKMPGI
jgi:hypothetical protein